MSYDPKSSQHLAMQVSRRTLWVNAGLSVFKLLAGLLAHSSSMISDAVHSASDVLSTVAVMIGIRLSNQQADAEHEYGHERLECIAAILLSVALALTGAGIGWGGIGQLRSPAQLAAPGRLALIAAVLSVVVKELMFRYTRSAAQKIASTALMADAWHHRSDALSSIGAFVGILGARLGYPILDPVASLVICCFIWKASYDIFRDAVHQLVDESCSAEMEEQLRQTVLSQPGVLRLDLLQTRQFGARVYVDVEFSADAELSLARAHEIAEGVHDAVEKGFPEVKHCMVHVNPFN